MSNATVVRSIWWREAEAAWLVLLVVTAYFLRAGDLPIRGEEPTRAQIAREMVERNDWLVPRVQGDPFRIRPPLQNWLIAASCVALGSWDTWALRLHAVVATLCTTLLIYGYSRTCLTRTGAFVAAAAFATLADMFQMGRQAETEAIFIFLLSSALLLWHWGIVKCWPDTLAWCAGYAFTALAMLTKGLQAPIYFVLATAGYLALTGQIRRLFTLAHLGGIVAAVAVLSLWAVPYALAQGLSGLHAAWLGDPAMRLQQWAVRVVVVHLLTYPCEIAAGTLPWSLLLLAYLQRDLRQRLGAARPQAFFTAICAAIAFPTCWIHPGGQPRFFAPLFPCLAVLIGIAVERCAASDATATLRAAWRRYLATVATAMLLAAVGALVLACRPALLPIWTPPAHVLAAYILAAVGLATLVLRARRHTDAAGVRMATGASVCFLVITFTGIVTDVRLARSANAAAAMRRVKEALPPGQQLVSLGGRIDCLFSYHFGPPSITPLPTAADGDFSYFCVESHGTRRPQLPFAWEEIGFVPLDRNRRPVPERVVVVGRRLSSPARLPVDTVSRR